MTYIVPEHIAPNKILNNQLFNTKFYFKSLIINGIKHKTAKNNTTNLWNIGIIYKFVVNSTCQASLQCSNRQVFAFYEVVHFTFQNRTL